MYRSTKYRSPFLSWSTIDSNTNWPINRPTDVIVHGLTLVVEIMIRHLILNPHQKLSNQQLYYSRFAVYSDNCIKSDIIETLVSNFCCCCYSAVSYQAITNAIQVLRHGDDIMREEIRLQPENAWINVSFEWQITIVTQTLWRHDRVFLSLCTHYILGVHWP